MVCFLSSHRIHVPDIVKFVASAFVIRYYDRTLLRIINKKSKIIELHVY